MQGQCRLGLTLLLIAGSHLTAGSTEVFRCGNSFSDLPCPNATVRTDHPDARSREQQTQSRNAARRDHLAAQSLQDQRHQDELGAREAQRLAGVTPPPPKPQAKTPAPAWPPRRRYGPPSPYFTARDADAAQQVAKKK